MSEIEITEDQREYLEALRAELEEDFLGPYGHVRTSDALQFLIDSHEGELATDSAVSGDENEVVEDDADESDSEAADEEVDEEGAEQDDGDDEQDDGDDEQDDGDDEQDDGDDEQDDGDDDAETDDAEDDDSDDEDDDAPSAGASGGGGGRLNAMMQLLDTHEDKWREGDGEARYEVDLPDGSTESAQTKDDVRALLFKNY
jgi:hypothetical protein